jgi:hypothetical protein
MQDHSQLYIYSWEFLRFLIEIASLFMLWLVQINCVAYLRTPCLDGK